MNGSPRKLGRYDIIREVGRGSMGVVYKAHDPLIDREVALKAIQLSFQVTDEEKEVYLSRFYREAQAAGKLNHPAIVTIYDVGEDKEAGVPFIVMEFLEGTTLQEVISNGNLMPLEDVNSIMVQIAKALHYAHKQGIVHRDIKSANIVVVEGLKTKITDFGIAKLPSSDLTRTGQFVGTPNYMSPEQIEGNAEIDGRSDLFSLGVIFYMLLTGERPFGGDNFSTVSYKIVHVDPPPPRVVNPAIPEAYNNILAKLLAKDVEQRYQTGEELADDLQKALNNEPVSASEVVSGATDGLEEIKPFVPVVEPAREESLPSPPAVPSPSSAPLLMRRWIPIAGALVLLGLAVGAGMKWMAPPSTAPPPVVIQPLPQPESRQDETLVNVSKQNAIRARWDLAVNYFTNGMYDKSIAELNELLAIDPNHAEAKKYLELVKAKKESEENKRLTRLNARRNASQSITKTPQEPAPLPQSQLQTERVQLELEHPFPSGTFSVYQDNKLIFQAILSGKEKKVLMIRTYSGKVSGFVDLPLGKSTLGLSLICKPLGISVYKTVKADLKQGDSRKLKLRYTKSTKQLDVKWT